MGRGGDCRAVRAAWCASLLTLALVARAKGEVATYSECRTAYDLNDPPCKHNTSLWTALSPHPANCAHCMAPTAPRDGREGNASRVSGEDRGSCPAGWAGVDCSACQTRDACPDIVAADGARRKAVACTNACLVPTAEETSRPSPFGADWEDGKVFSCRCGGDARTDPYCQFQKDTTFLFHVADGERSEGDDKNAQRVKMHVKEYAGIPNLGEDALPWNYEYAFAPVWDANFSSCAWRVSSCLEPLPASEDCAIYECAAGKVACPPADLPRCPGRDALGCGRGPNTTKKYWQHPCNPLVTPGDRGMTFWCSLNRTSEDAYGGGGGRLCYWNQQGVIPSFAVTCDVGNCVYDGAGTGEESIKNHCPAAFTPPEFWTGDLITRVVMGVVAVALVFAAAWYVRLESASLYSVPAAAAFEHVAAMRAGGSQAPSKHARTPSAVLGARRTRRASPESLYQSDERVASSSADSDDEARDPSSASAPTARARPVVSWENVRVYATAVTASNPGGVVKKILRGVSGHAGPGPSDASGTRSVGSGVFAILGPSGAGKSTLLDFLAGRTPKGQASRGTVNVDGVRISSKEMRAISGYVPQDDVLPGTSTVWEHLLFNAMLRLPERTPREELYRCVVGWSNELGLGKVAESRIGDQFTRGLSGGEKRRVSIATALLTSPAIMFLDEPTTGLDSTNAAKVVDILAALGDGGVTVVLSIHQPRPDVFRLLDRVLVMSKTGDVVYCGPSASAEAHFASLARPSHLGGAQKQGNARSARFLPEGVNVADYVLDTVLRSSDEDVRSMVTAFRGSEMFESDRAFLASVAARAAGAPAPFSGARKKTAPFGKQLKLLCGRLLRKLFRHPFLIGVHFLASFSTALGVGFIFLNVGADQAGIQNRLGALFFVLLYLTLMSLSSLPVWREDRLLFLRERADGVYGVDAYFISALLFDVLPMRVLPPFFFGLTTYAMIGLNEGTEVSLFIFVLTLVFTNICATSMCMAIGAAAKSVAVANAIASLCFLVSTLFGGFLLNKDQIPWYVRWVAKLSFLNYGYEALVSNEFAKNPTTFTLTAAWNSSTLPDEVPVPGEKVLSTFGFDSDRMVPDILAVCAQAVAFAIVCYLMLRNAEGGPWRAAMDWLGRRAVARDGDAGSSRRRSLDRERDGNTAPLLGFASGEDRSDDDDSVLGVALDVDEESSEEASPSVRFPERQSGRLTDIDEESSVRGAPAALAALRDAETAEERFFVAEPPAPTSPAPFERHVLSWEDVTCDLVGGRAILRGVSGIAGVDAGLDAGSHHAHNASTSTATDASPFGPFESTGGTRRHRADLFAILGPSGAGKSTLLDILAGRPSANRVVGGTIRVNGVVADAAVMRGLAGYVPQDDVLPGTSTVWEHLTFHATLRIKRDFGNLNGGANDSSIRSVVSHTMRSLGIDGVAHTFVGDEWTRGLSGGEKRRVSIATELLTSPAIMFLDEPTTGLDSTNAAKVVDILAALGDGGVTVVLSIHQPRPDVFRLLDRILVMSGTGRAVYCGPSASAEAHFASLGYAPPRPTGVNVADYVLDIVLRASDEVAERMVVDFDASAAAARDATARARIAAMHAESGRANSRKLSLPKTRKFRASFGTQTKALWGRVAKNVRRHPFLIALHFVATALASFFVGAVFFSAGRDTGGIQNRMGSLFFILLYLTLMSLSSLPVWREDRALFLREKAAGAYDTASYFVAVVVFDVLALRVLPPLFFALVSYPMIGLHGFDSDETTSTDLFTLVRCVCTFTLVLILVNVAASALCMAIGIVAPSNATANACGLLVLLVNLLCGGFFLNEQRDASEEEDVSFFNPVRLLTGASFVNRAFEALLINEFLDAGTFEFTPKFKNGGGGGARSSISVDVAGDEVLRFFKFGDSNAVLTSDLGALCGLALGYVALAFFLLKWTTRRMGVD